MPEGLLLVVQRDLDELTGVVDREVVAVCAELVRPHQVQAVVRLRVDACFGDEADRGVGVEASHVGVVLARGEELRHHVVVAPLEELLLDDDADHHFGSLRVGGDADSLEDVSDLDGLGARLVVVGAVFAPIDDLRGLRVVVDPQLLAGDADPFGDLGPLGGHAHVEVGTIVGAVLDDALGRDGLRLIGAGLLVCGAGGVDGCENDRGCDCDSRGSGLKSTAHGFTSHEHCERCVKITLD